MFDFSNYSTKSKYYDDWNQLVIRKMKDETSSVAIEEFFRLNQKMYSFLVDNQKATDMNRTVVAILINKEYKDAKMHYWITNV